MSGLFSFGLHLLYPALAVAVGGISIWYAKKQDETLKAEISTIEVEIAAEKAKQMQKEKFGEGL